MAAGWSCENVVAEHRDLQLSNAMALDYRGENLLLAGRRNLALICLDNPSVVKKRVSRTQQKYDVTAAEWNPVPAQGHTFAIASGERAEISAWSEGAVISGVTSLKAHTRTITDLNWHRTEPHLLTTCSIDTFVHIWDTRETRKPVASLSAIAGASQVKWNKLNPHILASGHDSDVRVWDQRKPSQPLQYIAAHLSKIHSLDWSPNHENQLVTSSNDCTVKFFDITNPRRAENFINTLSPVWRARYTPFGEGVVTVVVPQLRRGENSLLLWSLTDMSSPVHTFVGHSDVVLEFEYRHNSTQPNDYHLVTWARDHSLRIWKIDQHLQKLCGRETEEEALLGEAADAYSITSSEFHQGDVDVYSVVEASSAESKGGTESSEGAAADVASVLSITPNTTDSEVMREPNNDEECRTVTIEAGQDVIAPLASIPEVRTEDKDHLDSGPSIPLGGSAPIGSSVGGVENMHTTTLGSSIGSNNSGSLGSVGQPMTLGQEFSLLNTSLDNSQSQVNSVEVLAAVTQSDHGDEVATLRSANEDEKQSWRKTDVTSQSTFDSQQQSWRKTEVTSVSEKDLPKDLTEELTEDLTAECTSLENTMEYSKKCNAQGITIDIEQEDIHKVISEMTYDNKEVLSDQFNISEVPQKLHLRTVKVNSRLEKPLDLFKFTSVKRELVMGIASNIIENQNKDRTETMVDINNSQYSVEITKIPDEIIENNHLQFESYSSDYCGTKSEDFKRIGIPINREVNDLDELNVKDFVTHVKVESPTEDICIELDLNKFLTPNDIENNSIVSSEKDIDNLKSINSSSNDLNIVPPFKITVSTGKEERNAVIQRNNSLNNAVIQRNNSLKNGVIQRNNSLKNAFTQTNNSLKNLTKIGDNLIGPFNNSEIDDKNSYLDVVMENIAVINLELNPNTQNIESKDDGVMHSHEEEAVIHVINSDMNYSTILNNNKNMLGPTGVKSGIVIADGSVICQDLEIPAKIVYLSTVNDLMNCSYEQICASIAPELFEEGVYLVGENLTLMGSDIFLVSIELCLEEDQEKSTRISITSPTKDLRTFHNKGVNFVMIYNVPIQGNSPLAFSAIDFGRSKGKSGSVRNAPGCDEPGLFQCDKCDKTYKCKSSLKSHKVTHNVEKLYKCDECDKAFHFSGPLLIHKRTHTDERPYKCQSCSSSFRARANLIFHQRLHTGEKPIICRDCGQGYRDYTSLKRHRIKTHSNYNVKCTHCSQVLSAEEHSAHMWKIHNVLYADNMKIKCEKCDEILENREAYTVHMVEHERDDYPNPSKIIDFEHRCGICSMSFQSKPAMLSHIQIHAAVKKWRCRYCNLAFLYKYLLVAHAKDEHPDEPTWYCQYCEASFETSRNMNAHSCRMIQGNYNCPHCDWKTQLRHRFFRHLVKVHPDDKTPYYCEFCKSSYEDPNKLRYHQKRNHPEKILSLTLQRDVYKQKENGNNKEDKGTIDMSHIKVVLEEDAIIYNIPNDLRNDQLFEKEVKFKCYYCEAKFPQKNPMTRHILKIHPDKQAYKCLTCDIFFSTSYQSKTHYRKYHRFSETAGRDPNRNKKYMIKKAEEFVNELEEKEDDIKKLYQFPCKFCSMEYRERRSLINHYSKWHPNEEWDYLPKDKNYKFNKKIKKKQKLVFYECCFKETCKISFDDKRMVVDHIYNAHGVKKEEAEYYIDLRYVTDIVRRGRRPKNMVNEVISNSEDELEDEFNESYNIDVGELKEIDEDNLFEKDDNSSEEIYSALDIKKILYRCRKCQLSFHTKKEYREHDAAYATEDKDCRIDLKENRRLQNVRYESTFCHETIIQKDEFSNLKRVHETELDCVKVDVSIPKRLRRSAQKVVESLESKDISHEISQDISLEDTKDVLDVVKIISVNTNTDGTLNTSSIQEKNY